MGWGKGSRGVVLVSYSRRDVLNACYVQSQSGRSNREGRSNVEPQCFLERLSCPIEPIRVHRFTRLWLHLPMDLPRARPQRRTDNGGAFKSTVYCDWARANQIERTYIRPRVSTDNAYVERFNGTLRSEVLDRYKFRSLAEVQRMIDDWRIRYNVSRSNSGLGGLSPLQYAYMARQ